MKKENIYVKTKSREQADLYRNVLKEIGQTIREDFNTNTQLDEPYLDYRENGWILGCASASEKEITFGQLIDLLNEPKKLAVKVENEKEFKAIEKHLGKKSFFTPPFQGVSYPAFIYLDGGKYPDEDFVSIDCGEIYLKDYQIIPFADFAEEKGIKLPLITTLDRVDLYENDNYLPVYLHGNEWKLESGSLRGLYKDHTCIVNPDRCKAFSTKQTALEWIEAQKPKEIKVQLFDECVFALVSKKEILFKWKNGATHSTYRIVPSDVEEIMNALKELEK